MQTTVLGEHLQVLLLQKELCRITCCLAFRVLQEMWQRWWEVCCQQGGDAGGLRSLHKACCVLVAWRGQTAWAGLVWSPALQVALTTSLLGHSSPRCRPAWPYPRAGRRFPVMLAGLSPLSLGQSWLEAAESHLSTQWCWGDRDGGLVHKWLDLGRT